MTIFQITIGVLKSEFQRDDAKREMCRVANLYGKLTKILKSRETPSHYSYVVVVKR